MTIPPNEPVGSGASRAEVLSRIYSRAAVIRRRARLRLFALASAGIGAVAFAAAALPPDSPPTVLLAPPSSSSSPEATESPRATPSDTPTVRKDYRKIGTDVCINSSRPECGRFYYDPPPQPNRPLTISITSPSSPRAGDEVTFNIVVDDDARIDACYTYHFGDDAGNGCRITTDCVPMYGRWEPPEPSPGHLEVALTHAYEKPGTYEMYFQIVSGSGGACHDPFGESGEQRITVTVR